MGKASVFIFSTLLSSLWSFSAMCYRQKMVVCVPVADLRSYPESAPRGVCAPALSRDMKGASGRSGQESQLLYGEHVLAEEVPGHPGWLKVEALEQQRCLENRWAGYHGYIKKDQAQLVWLFPVYDAVVKSLYANIYLEKSEKSPVVISLSMGTRLQADASEGAWTRVLLLDGKKYYVKTSDINMGSVVEGMSFSELRRGIVDSSKLFLGTPYVWNGRSVHRSDCKNHITGVDCSSVFDLVFRAHGIDLPHDAHDKFLISKPILYGKDLRPGDFIFFSTPRRSMPRDDEDLQYLERVARAARIKHIMMYLGGGLLFEVTGDPDSKGFSSARHAKDKAKLGGRIVSVEERFGKPIDQLCHSQICSHGNFIYFGSLLDVKQAMSESSSSGVIACDIGGSVDELVDAVVAIPNMRAQALYASPLNLSGRQIYDVAKCYVRRGVAKKLCKVQQELEKQGLGLKITDGYRPVSAQCILWEAFPVSGLVANPHKGCGSRHNRGAAVDVTLVRLSDGQELDMGCPVDELSERAFADYTASLSNEAIRNRRLLRRLMIKHGFSAISPEWWHFNDLDWEHYDVEDVSLAALEAKVLSSYR